MLLPHLVYAIGLPPSMAVESHIRRTAAFAQYGRIVKVAVNRNMLNNSGSNSGGSNSSTSGSANSNERLPSASAYITFSRESEAALAIRCTDGFFIEGRVLRSSFGTTKYCNAYLRGVPCNNPECLYLHKPGQSAELFSKVS